MGTLTEYLKDKAAKLRAEKPERERLIEDWRSALDRLLDQLEQWVREADTERILEVRRTEHKFNDEGMGPYTAPGLDITLDGETVNVIPVARRIITATPLPGAGPDRRADGRVDLKRHGATVSLYRVKDGAGDKWFVIREGVWGGMRNVPIVHPLDRNEFEKDLASLFG